MNEKNIRAAEILGWKKIESFKVGPALYDTAIPSEPYRELPDFCNDPASALLLCAHMAAKGWKVKLLRDSNAEVWECWFVSREQARTVCMDAPTFPEAVTLAFLAANEQPATGPLSRALDPDLEQDRDEAEHDRADSVREQQRDRYDFPREGGE